MKGRYYVSRALQHAEPDFNGQGIRVPAREIEGAVAAQIADALDDPLNITAAARINFASTQLHSFIERASEAASAIRSRDHAHIRNLIVQIRMLANSVEVDLSVHALAEALGAYVADDAAAVLTLSSGIRLTRTGRAVRLVHNDGSRAGSRVPDPTLVRLLVTARRWWAQLRAEEIDVQNLAAREGVTASYMTRIVRMAFLGPEVVEAILAGKHPSWLDGGSITSPAAIPISWLGQRGSLLAASKR